MPRMPGPTVTTAAPPGDDLPSAPDLIDGAPCGLMVTSEDWTLLRVNRTFCAWVGREPEELVGRLRLPELLSGGDGNRDSPSPSWPEGPAGGRFERSLRHADGHALPAVWSVGRREHRGRTLHEVAVFLAGDGDRDVVGDPGDPELLRARRRADDLQGKEQAAQQALRVAHAERDRQQAIARDRALLAEQMVGIVSHDLRNPLSVVRMCAHILQRSGLTDKQLVTLGRLEASNERAIRLIGDLLDYSRGRLGGVLTVRREPLDLHAVVETALDDFRVAHPERLFAHRRSGEGICFASGDRMLQLIGNLVANALAYGAADRPVTVTSAIEADSFAVSVHNEGPAIASDAMPRLFEPLVRGDVRGHVSSIGLGLFIVREIAQAHGGEVTVSSSEREGTVFRAVFPRMASQQVAPSGVPSLPATAATGMRERERQDELDRLNIDEFSEVAYDDITRLAASTCDVPIALISLVDGNRQWFKARVGLAARETPRDQSFCAHAILDADDVFVVEDASVDPRFLANPLVTGEPGIRFYAGAPLVSSNGAALGTVCVIDRKPRTLDPKQLELLQFLAQQVVVMLERREADRMLPSMNGRD